MKGGIVESIRRGLISGFVEVPDGEFRSIGLLDDNVLVEAVDVFASATSSGGWTGFGLPIPASLFDGEPHDLTVFIDGLERVALSHGEFVFFGDPQMLGVPPQIERPPMSQEATGTALQTSLAVQILRAAQVQSASLERILAQMSQAVIPEPVRTTLEVVAERQAHSTPAERYGREVQAALHKRQNSRDFIWFGVIDWFFRIQRPQHLATSLADQGRRVFYISINFGPADAKGRFEFVSNPYPGVFEVRLKIGGAIPENIYGGFTDGQIEEIVASVDELISTLNLSEPTAVLQYPTWLPVALQIPGVHLVHDCLDYVGGFSNVPDHVVALERSLVARADTVVATSKPLQEHLLPRQSTIVRNGADIDFFSSGERSRSASDGIIVGYFGAIAEWYQVEWLEEAARARPEWLFRLIGNTTGCDVSALHDLANVELLGEQPYETLPNHLADFDVAIIPFKLTPLIECTNPVKLYEYAAGGKPVVASRMPELELVGAPVFIADDAPSFVSALEEALSDRGEDQATQLKTWASDHDWSERGRQFIKAIPSPCVSIVMLTYNNWSFSKACIDSILRFSDYENLEIIVVDNASTDETRSMLRKMVGRDDRIKIILNSDNLGFAAGNNVGMAASTGDYIILLNNDTYVTRGWVQDLIRPLQMDQTVGLTGPVTNNIGNEQKISIAYRDMEEMAVESRKFVRSHTRETLEVSNLAFFCVAMRRDVYERVGGLDERYGLGFFEDDDYCKMVKREGYRILIVDDVFIHHHLSASFNALGEDRRSAQLAHNKQIYEEKWGPWEPHQYRLKPGFG